jgi:hypothetical protein
VATRNSDGSFRSTTAPDLPTPRTLVARWVEESALKLRILGLTFSKIAEMISRSGRGEIIPVVPLPEVLFPPDYSITEQAAHKAYLRALQRRENPTPHEWRKLHYLRVEEYGLALQKKANAGDPKSIDCLARLHRDVADINGYRVPSQVQVKAEVANEEVDDNDQSDVLQQMTHDEAKIVMEIMARCRQRLKDLKTPPAK